MAEPEESDSERNYERGGRAAWTRMLGECLRNLGYDGPEGEKLEWIAEREAAIAQLRMLCEDFGDNDWEADLHLADVIEKHLGKYLEAEE